MTPKQRKIESLIHDVWRQNPRCGTVSTMNPCDCGRSATRGAGSCKICVWEKLSKTVGELKATEYTTLVGLLQKMEWEMLNGQQLTSEPGDHTSERRARLNADTRTMDEVVEEIKQARNDET